MEHKIFNNDNMYLVLSVFSGLFVGILITWFCFKYKLAIFGVNINIFIAPVIAGLIETYISNHTRHRSSGAISSIVLFFVTNGIGWLFPSQPLSFNIFTIGGFLLMLQAAFPIMINYILIALLFLLTYFLGLIGSFIGLKLKKIDDSPMSVSDIEEMDVIDIQVYNSKPDLPIKEYHGIVFYEDVIEFEEKGTSGMIKYMGSSQESKNLQKHEDYSISRKYIIHNLKKEARKINANAIIDMEFEYTNYNQQFPPDVIIAAYGTAVTIDEKYL